SSLKNYQDLPMDFKKYVDFIEKEIGQELWMISVGPERSETILKD
ncbi:MAG: adenylosuccinate synthetase, partial [Bacteroidetes bacterium]|nr:adenylosuccinate synthetase [Bacteroidota bacterium]